MTRDGRNPAAAGGDISMWERAQYLAAHGHQVTVVASRFPGADPVEVVDGIHVVRLGRILTLWLRTFWFYLRHGRGQFDVVVAEGFGGSRIPRFAPLYVREPVLTEWHQVHTALFAAQYPWFLVPPLKLLEQLTALVHRNTILVARTEEWRREFPRLGFKPENVVVVPACISQEWLAQGRSGQVSEPRIVWLGRFLKYKCPDHVVRVMPRVLAQVPNAQLILAGRHTQPAYEGRLRDLVRQLDLERHVTFRFDLSESEKRSLLNSSRVMVLPSSVEGFGIVVLEANACGVPVVASSGVPEGAVADQVNGLRYAFGDLEALASRVIEILIDDSMYARLSDSSLSFARRFEFSAVCAQYERVILQAAAPLPRSA